MESFACEPRNNVHLLPTEGGLKYKHIGMEKLERGILRIEFQRPEVHNAFHEEMIREITSVFEKLKKHEDNSIRLVEIRGQGRSFCAGADLNWMRQMKNYTEEENLKDSVKLERMFQLINDCPYPVLSIVQGAAIGGGAGILAVSDYVISMESSQIGFSEVRLGLIPAVISPYVIAKVGLSNARAYFLTGAKFSAKKALAMNLIHETASDGVALEKQYNRIVESIMAGAPGSQAKIKGLMSEVWPLLCAGEIEAKQLRELTTKLISSTRVGDEAQEGMSALLEKRRSTYDWSISE